MDCDMRGNDRKDTVKTPSSGCPDSQTVGSLLWGVLQAFLRSIFLYHRHYSGAPGQD